MRLTGSVLALALSVVAGFALAQDKPHGPPGPGSGPGPAKGERAVSERQGSTDKREGALDSWVNPNTSDPTAKLELMHRDLWTAEQQLVNVQFMLTYGDTVRMEMTRFNSGGELIPGWVFTPKTLVQGKRYPAIVMVHGGFHERLSDEWFPWLKAAVDRGYVVMFPEYRGSRGYGEITFDNDYGVTDTADVVAAGGYMAAKPFVDPDRVGILGHSRGGMVTLLAIEKEPKLFKAAVDIAGIADFLAYMSYKPDYRRIEVAKDNKSFEGKLPDKNLPAYMAVSPVNFVDKIEAPVLFLATTGDKTVPLTLHIGRVVDAMKARNKVFEQHIYENAPGGHIYPFADTPEANDSLTRSLAFLDKYLMPAAAPAPGTAK